MSTSSSLPSRIISILAGTAAVLVFAVDSAPAKAAEPSLQLKDNDVWVMAGDSITAQRLHTNYIEAFYRTRHPEWHLHFRNSGIGGNRTSSILARFDYDVAAWRPTIVSIELGMNDVNGSVEEYIKGMKALIAKIRAIPAQPVLISSSPVDDGSVMNDWKGERCQKLHPFTEALQKLAEEENVVFVDQYHALIDLWGQNRRKGEALAVKNGTWPPKATPVPATPAATPAPGAKPVRKPEPPIAPSLIPLGGNPVHPGPVGQYNMAAVILEGLKADGDVSSATIKADGKVVEAKRCKITEVSAKDGKLSFTRLDECGPWPIEPTAKSAIDLLPATLKLTEYMLRVPGLPEGEYHVIIEGKPAATVSAKQLADGWNISTVFEGVLADRATHIDALITNLEGKLNTDWRAASKANEEDHLAAAQKAIDQAEEEIQKAIQPAALHFEIAK
ncbi:MAG TPA: SGNH/GDSL hydrolase family protein [Chthoniobacter sp.]|jgi:lysophospholipase L1-like esterase